jgi:peptidoglycan/LPS O-acetylase OafA/YrhL
LTVPATTGPRGAPPNLATPRYPLLDSMRGVAALSVFAAHTLIFLATEGIGGESPLLTRLDPGIAIFLLLSAFLLYRPFVKARYDGTEPPAVVPFFIRRALRIVPVYWLALTVLGLYFGQRYLLTPEGAVRFYGFLQVYDARTITGGIGQAWTMCVEVTFYVMLPVWALALRRLPFRTTRGFVATELAALAALFVAGVLWKAVAFARAPDVPGIGVAKVSPGLFTLPAYLDGLAIGMALAVASVVLADRPQGRLVGLIDRRPGLLVAAAVALYWLSGIAGGTYEAAGPWGYVLHQGLNVAVALCLFLPAIFGDWRRGWFRRVLANRALVWMATISYGFYLWHLGVMLAFKNAGWLDSPGPVAWVAASFAVTVALAAVSWYGVGRPFILLGARLPRGASRTALARAGRETPSLPASLPPERAAGG